MKNTKFSFNRAWLVLTALLMSALVAVSFTSCKSDDDDDDSIHYSLYPVELSADDPVSGVYSTTAYSDYGAEIAFILRPSIVYATASSCAALDSIDGLTENSDYIKNPNTYDSEVKYLNLKDSNKVYVVYNLLSGADSSDGISDSELDKHSGVILFQAKYSPYGTPAVDCWYGVKFQFLTKDDESPTSVNKDTVFSDTKIYIEGAAGDAYKNIATLNEAVEKFAFNNADCFNTTCWTASASGADKTSRTVSSVVVPTKNVFSKVE